LNGFDLSFFLDRIYRINEIFFARGEIPIGRRPFYPVDPVNPVCIFFKLESIPLFFPHLENEPESGTIFAH